MEPYESLLGFSKNEFENRAELPGLSSLSRLGKLSRSLIEEMHLFISFYVVLDTCLRIDRSSEWELLRVVDSFHGVQELNATATIFEYLAELLNKSALRIKTSCNLYYSYLLSYAVEPKEIESCIVYVKGEREGTGVVVNYRGNPFVITCAHVVGKQESTVKSLSNIEIICGNPCLDESVDVAVLPVLSPTSLSSVPMPENPALAEVYLKTKRKVKMWYRLGEGGCGYREGSIVNEVGAFIRIDVGHPRLGESGSPLFFPLDEEQENRLSLLGMFIAREMETVRAGAQTVGAFMVKVSDILRVLQQALVTEEGHDTSER